MTRNDRERGIAIRPESQPPFDPHLLPIFALIRLSRQTAQIAQHQYDGARIGKLRAAGLLDRQVNSRNRRAVFENRELKPCVGIVALEMSDHHVLIKPIGCKPPTAILDDLDALSPAFARAARHGVEQLAPAQFLNSSLHVEIAARFDECGVPPQTRENLRSGSERSGGR